jgi:hypothetical protein
LLGKNAGGLSASTTARLKQAWVDEHARWLDRDLSAKRYVYFWVDGIHVQARLENDAQCLLVIIGATPGGKKELVGLIDGVRESAQSWKELLLDLKRRGLTMGPDSAPGFGSTPPVRTARLIFGLTLRSRMGHNNPARERACALSNSESEIPRDHFPGVRALGEVLFGTPAQAETRYAGSTEASVEAVRLADSLKVIDAFFRDLPETVGLGPQDVQFTLDGFRYRRPPARGAGAIAVRSSKRRAHSATRPPTSSPCSPPAMPGLANVSNLKTNYHWSSNGHRVAFEAIASSRLMARLRQ